MDRSPKAVQLPVFHLVLGGSNIKPTESTPLSEVLQLGLEKYLDSLAEISSQASKEYALEKVRMHK